MTTIRTGVALLAVAMLSACDSSNDSGPPLVAETFRNPPEVRSAGGELRTSLNVATGPVQVGGQTVTTTVYNGMYIPPVLRLRPGDTLFLDIDNRSSDPTNLHLHGLNVSPRINSDATVGDNVFVSVDPANRLSYRIAIPSTHNPGLYWYHTHLHMLAQRQVMGGLSGGLIIDGILIRCRSCRVGRARDAAERHPGHCARHGPDDISPSSRSIRMVNGQVNPTLSIRPGETQFSASPTLGPMCTTGCASTGTCFTRSLATAIAPLSSRLVRRYSIPPSSRASFWFRGGPRQFFATRPGVQHGSGG